LIQNRIRILINLQMTTQNVWNLGSRTGSGYASG
jgi:hypothetical protein